jgi:glycosyltransferase involved in cell wall biosynthesis
MRIAHVISSLKRGGAESVLASLVNHHTFNTDEHHIIYFHDGPLVEQLKKKNIYLYHIPYSLLFPFYFMYTLSKIKPQIIHTLLWFSTVCSALSGFLLRIPVVGIMHNNIEQNSAYKNYIDWFTLRLLTQYGAVSESVADGLSTYHQWLNRSHIAIVHNGIDLPSITAQKTLRADYNVPDNAIVIATVGRFQEVKRYPWLIDRFAQLYAKNNTLYLLLIGTGSQEQLLREYVTMKKIENSVGFIVNQNAYPLYPLCDIFTLTSKKEGLSIALLEAMSYGKSSIITHEGKKHPVITDGHDGFIVPADDTTLFCSQLETLINNPHLRVNMGKNALKTATERFSRNGMASAYKSLFIRALPSLLQ